MADICPYCINTIIILANSLILAMFAISLTFANPFIIAISLKLANLFIHAISFTIFNPLILETLTINFIL